MSLVRLVCLAVICLTATMALAKTPALRHYSGSLNINTASAADLTRLPGIGEVTAYRIVKARESRGSFRDTRELLTVKGVSKPLYAGLAPHVTVKGENSLKVRLDLNRASRSLLLGLPGATSEEVSSLLAQRKARGRFTAIEELRSVPGLDERRYLELTELVAVIP
jgi:competence protein ComEA